MKLFKKLSFELSQIDHAKRRHVQPQRRYRKDADSNVNRNDHHTAKGETIYSRVFCNLKKRNCIL